LQSSLMTSKVIQELELPPISRKHSENYLKFPLKSVFRTNNSTSWEICVAKFTAGVRNKLGSRITYDRVNRQSRRAS
jgi:hypothetical protein